MRRTLAPVPGSVHFATMTSIRAIADGVYEYVLTLPPDDAGLVWRPGQFISVECGKEDSGEPRLRSYSIASSPGSGRIVLIIKLIPGGAASTWFAGLSVGHELRFTGPMGFFVNELQHADDAVYAATGTGIAPVVPMVRELLARPGETGRVIVKWGLRTEADLFWQDELGALAHPRLDVTIHLSKPAGAWTGPRGRVTAPVLELLPQLAKPVFYLVGNGAMIRELKTELQARGVDRKRQIRTESFFD